MKLRLAPVPRTADARIEWDDTPCLLCGQRDDSILLEARDPNLEASSAYRFAVVQCRRCELVYTNPRPTPESMASFYSPGYRPHQRKSKSHPAAPSTSPIQTLRDRDPNLPRQGRGRLLDFGCGSGEYASRMRDQGWHVTALDVASQALQHVSNPGSIRVLTGTLPHADLAPGSLDVITMWHSLEHVHEPMTTLRAARATLIPGGRLYVSVPNFASWSRRAFGSAWFGLDLPRHLTHFTSQTLSDMLEVAGFGVESLRTLRHGDWVRSSARLAARQQTHIWSRPLLWKPVAKLAALMPTLTRSDDCLLVVARRPE